MFYDFVYVLGATSLWEFNMEVAHKPKMLERPSLRPSVCHKIVSAL